MARIRMVTRTVKGMAANVLCMDIPTATAFHEKFTIGGTFANEHDLLKALQKAYDTNTCKLVAVMSKEVVEQLYGMPEDEFIKLAEKLPPRSANEVNENEE